MARKRSIEALLPRNGSGTAIINNYETLLGKGNSPAKLLDIDDVKARFDGIFHGGNWTKVAICVCNPRAGLVDAADVLRAVIEAQLGSLRIVLPVDWRFALATVWWLLARSYVSTNHETISSANSTALQS